MSAMVRGSAATHALSKFVSTSCRTDSAHSPSPSDKDEECMFYICCSKHHTTSHCRPNVRTPENLSAMPSKSARLAKLEYSPSDSESQSDSSNNCNRKVYCSKNDGPKVLRTAKYRLRNTLDYLTYCLSDKSSKCAGLFAQSVAMWTKQLQVQIETIIFTSFNSISIISSLSAFKLACDTNSIHEGASLWLYTFFMEKPAAAALNSRLMLLS